MPKNTGAATQNLDLDGNNYRKYNINTSIAVEIGTDWKDECLACTTPSCAFAGTGKVSSFDSSTSYYQTDSVEEADDTTEKVDLLCHDNYSEFSKEKSSFVYVHPLSGSGDTKLINTSRISFTLSGGESEVINKHLIYVKKVKKVKPQPKLTVKQFTSQLNDII